MAKATRNDVAHLAQVSTAVVSYVFNDGPRKVSPKTKQRVEDAARKLNYQPNSIARALRTGNSKTLGAVINDLTNPFNASVYEELETLAAARGYSMLFGISHDNPAKEQQVIKQLINRNVEALFISPWKNIEIPSTQAENCRFVVLDVDQKIPNADTIATNLAEAVKMGVNHLFDHGHTNINLIMGRSFNGVSDGRIQGWYQEYAERGLPAGRIGITEYSRLGGYSAMMKILDDATNRPTAIFAGSDLIALGALRALHERGVKVPEEMAIISFDGAVDSQYTYPELTVVQQDAKAIARLALDVAINKQSEQRSHLLPAKLVIRQSCGCNPKKS